MRMGNGSPSKVTSISIVQIRMHDRTLPEVRHVPILKKNLIFLRILDSKGCRINIDSSSIKVSRGALIFMKGKRLAVFMLCKD